MAKLPSIRRILPELFPDVKFMPQLANVLNPFIEQIVRALNKGLNINDNFDGEIRNVVLDGTFPTKISWSRANRPVTILVGKVSQVTGSAVAATSTVGIDWEFTQDNMIQINQVFGISPSPSAKYQITLEIKCG